MPESTPLPENGNATLKELDAAPSQGREGDIDINFDSILDGLASEAGALKDGNFKTLEKDNRPLSATTVPEETEEQQKVNEEGAAEAVEEAMVEAEAHVEGREPTDEEKEAAEKAAKEKEEEEDANLTDEEKEASEKKAKEAAETPEQKARRERDKDLVEAQPDPHTRPKTKEIIEGMKSKVATERDAHEKTKAELATLRKEAEELKKSPLPKEINDELTQLRQTVRELDATRDPQIIAKYDNKIKANTESVLDTLERFGLEKPAVEALRKQGVNFKSVSQYINMIETGKTPDGKVLKKPDGTPFEGDPETAEMMKTALRDNITLAKQKDEEVTTFKANFEEKAKAQQEQSKKYETEVSNRIQGAVNETIKKFNYLQKPADILETDAPAVRKQKEADIKNFNETVARYSEAVTKETGNPGDALVAARIGILYRDVIYPRMEAANAAQAKEIENLRGQIATLKNAGKISKTVSATPAPTRDQEQKNTPVSMDFGDIIDANARTAARVAADR